MLHLYFGKTFTSQITGYRTVHVTCEKCQTKFRYELTRTGRGSGEAPYFLGQTEAANRAKLRAQRNLEWRLEHEGEMVPCPNCHWVNEKLIRKYRERKYLWSVAIVLFEAAVLIAAMLHVYVCILVKAPADQVAIVVVYSLPLIGIFLFRGWLRRRIDPNRTYPQCPFVPLGTPPALIERNDPKTGETHLESVPNRYENTDLMTEWAVFRPGQVVMPAVCCVCMAPATTTYSVRFKVNKHSGFPAPLCGPCASQIRRRWWLIALVVAVVGLGLAALLAKAVPGLDDIGRWAIFIVIAVFPVPFAMAVVPNRMCQPYRLRTVDAARGIFGFRAASRAYTELLIDQVRQSNGDALR